MPKIIYGLDLGKKVTPIMVRDALDRCFFEAHCRDSGIGEDQATEKSYCNSVLKKAFTETGGDYEKPNKISLEKVINWLVIFSKSFRDPGVIARHQSEITELLIKL